jgi:MFS family permease
LGIEVSEVAGVIAIISGVSVVTSTVGSLLSGALSDKLGRRLPFIGIGTLLFAVGSVISALAWEFPALMAGALLSSFGIAIFLAVNQAVVLDILPGGSAEAGQYLGVFSFSQKIPNALAPLIAPLLLSLGAAAQPNFAALYVAAAVLAAVGGLIVAVGVRGVQ